ncbi:MAG: hypothetical protein ABR586_01740, partial [Thermoplasmatota archaeon]
ATTMTRLPHFLLLAAMTTIPFAAPADAYFCADLDLCDYLIGQAKDCLNRDPLEIPACMGLKGSACISFHLGGFVLGTPHITNLRLQFSAVGVDFMIAPNAEAIGNLNPRSIFYGFGVFTIDLSPDARSC